MPSDQQKRRFAKRLRSLRDAAGWTGPQLAERASAVGGVRITQQSVSDWEGGKAPRDPVKVDALATALGAGDELHRALGVRSPRGGVGPPAGEASVAALAARMARYEEGMAELKELVRALAEEVRSAQPAAAPAERGARRATRG